MQQRSWGREIFVKSASFRCNIVHILQGDQCWTEFPFECYLALTLQGYMLRKVTVKFCIKKNHPYQGLRFLKGYVTPKFRCHAFATQTSVEGVSVDIF